jgi:hypothetical protein
MGAFFYDAIKAHKIEEISLLFFVYNFEYYTHVTTASLIAPMMATSLTTRVVAQVANVSTSI